MFLKTIKLTNFRNYSTLDFKFKTPITILYGNNAQGKTNFLESVYFLATAKSPRADRDEEVIKEGEEVLRVEGEVVGEETDFLEIAMQNTEGRLAKRVKVNGVPKRVADYSQYLAVIYFAPEDINLVRGAPSLRRDHLDAVLSQIDREYKRSLSKYEEVITKKNRVLKAIRENLASMDQLTFWLEQQVLYGSVIQQKRQAFFAQINKLEKPFGEFNYQHHPSELTIERLYEYQPREIESAASLIGPHRDDFTFKLEERDLAKYGSRGEQRTAVMFLKLSEISFIEQALGERPVLLLDDIFSELDDQHKKYVFEAAMMQQSIITTVEIDEHLKEYFEKEAKVIKVDSGRVK
jgi:DNA replication and repair protein RecF